MLELKLFTDGSVNTQQNIGCGAYLILTDLAAPIEHKFSQSDLPAFTAFSLKVVLTGTNSSYPPLLKDMRGIALAV